jgi:hypothetical protein
LTDFSSLYLGFLASARHRSEQYFTSSQTLSHFLRHAKGLPQRAQGLLGKSAFFTCLGMREDRLFSRSRKFL